MDDILVVFRLLASFAYITENFKEGVTRANCRPIAQDFLPPIGYFVAECRFYFYTLNLETLMIRFKIAQ